MLQTIEGIYKNGKIELAETPQGISESRVFVTFLETKPTHWSEIIMQYQGVTENIVFESYRDELLSPKRSRILRMGYLLDTCVISDFIKGEENTLKRLKSTSPVDIFISSLTLMEVKYGLAINPQKALKIQSALETFLSSITTLSFAASEAEQAAQIRSILKTAGTPIGAYDLLIAATALTHHHILVTSNEREFQRVPNLQMENWRSS